MSPRMMVVSRDRVCPPADVIEARLFKDFDGDCDISQGKETDWQELEISFEGDHRDSADSDIATIRRDVEPESVRRELASWRNALASIEPRRSAVWLSEWLRGGQSLYLFTAPPTASERSNEALRAAMWSIQQAVGGLSHVMGEGWTNSDGFLVTWEVDPRDKPSGSWPCAVLDSQERWVGFQLEVANARHVQAFRDGRVPGGVRSHSTWPV